MAQENSSAAGMGLVIGALAVALAGVLWFVYSGGDLPGEDQADIRIELPNVEVDGG